MAITARWRMPPESSCGKLRSRRGIDADQLEQLGGALAGLASAHLLVRHDRVGDLRAHV